MLDSPNEEAPNRHSERQGQYPSQYSSQYQPQYQQQSKYTGAFQSMVDSPDHQYSAKQVSPKGFPNYEASMGVAWRKFFQGYTCFDGYASRREFWKTYLPIFVFNMVMVVLSLIGISSIPIHGNEYEVTDNPGAVALALIPMLAMFPVNLVLLLPSVAVTIRRLHDAGFTGWFWLLTFVPYVGPIAVLVFMALPTARDKRNYQWEPAAPIQ